jgi:hypothetical protein
MKSDLLRPHTLCHAHISSVTIERAEEIRSVI